MRGDSAIEKLELLTNQNPQAVAFQMSRHPTVEFAEPNFLIEHDQYAAANRQQYAGITPPLNQTSDATSSLLGQSFWSPNKLLPTAAPQAQGVEPNDPEFSNQWALSNTGQTGGQYGSDIEATTAWQTTTGAQSTVIAIIDSGVDFTHPDLANNRWTNPAPQSGDLHGRDYITESGTIVDEQGHGTAIAGIVSAQGDNGIGISGVMWR